jgi:hypothetical protein
MKVALKMLVLTGILWLVALAFQSRVTPAVMLDAVVPPKVLATMTPEERIQIQEQLRRASTPGYLSWVGAAAVLILSVTALKMAPETTPQKPN